MNIKTIVTVVAILTLSGCATIIDGKNQTFTLTTKGDTDKSNTECEVRNSKGAWTTDNKESIVIRRDSKDLIISCENGQQEGDMVIESSASVGFMALNFFIWDFCTISCIVDHSTGSLYEYPVNVSIPMRSNGKSPQKSTTDDIKITEDSVSN